MKLISCDNCGVVLDADKLKFPELWKMDEIGDAGEWDGERFVSVVPCPVCATNIREPE